MPMTDVINPLLTCLRCGGTWHQRGPHPPKKCPKCTNPRWHTPRETKQEVLPPLPEKTGDRVDPRLLLAIPSIPKLLEINQHIKAYADTLKKGLDNAAHWVHLVRADARDNIRRLEHMMSEVHRRTPPDAMPRGPNGEPLLDIERAQPWGAAHQHHCRRCGWNWKPRKDDYPKKCPSCQSKDWQTRHPEYTKPPAGAPLQPSPPIDPAIIGTLGDVSAMHGVNLEIVDNANKLDAENARQTAATVAILERTDWILSVFQRMLATTKPTPLPPTSFHSLLEDRGTIMREQPASAPTPTPTPDDTEIPTDTDPGPEPKDA